MSVLHHLNRRRAGFVLVSVSALASAGLLGLTAPDAAGASPDVVLSEVYGGGGNSGATYTNDFIELQNTSGSSVDLTGWSVQYASAAGASWQVTPLTGAIAAGATYLVAEAAGAGGTTPLPTAEVTGSIALSATAGKVALVPSTVALTCSTGCAAAGVRDLVGYGATASSFEGSAPAPAPSNTTSIARTAAGADTDDNAADFTAGSPTPGGGSPPPPPPGDPATIEQIQGSAHVSPLVGHRVRDVTGVVTAVAPNGFWIEDPAGDGDVSTSDAVFVFTGSKPSVLGADSVSVAGTVQEFRQGGTTSANLSTTEIGAPTIAVSAHGAALPSPVLVGPGGRVPPAAVIKDDATGDIEQSSAFDPAHEGLDFWESLEGMLVEVDNARVVGPTAVQFGETPIAPRGSSVQTHRGGLIAQPGDFNPERLILDDELAPSVTAKVGDTLTGATVGVIDYDFGTYYLEALATPTVHDGGLAREVTAKPGRHQLAVATFNVENLAATNPQSKFDGLASVVVGNLRSPDVLALEEVQDNDGATDDGVVAADQTLQRLVDAIAAAGGPTYSWREIDPVNDTSGGEPGGNIRVAFLFRTDGGLTFVDRAGGEATTPVAVSRVHGRAQLSVSPGYVAAGDPAWADSRTPLAGEFRWHGQQLIVVANHFDSKGGDDPLMGRFQPIRTPSEVQRHQQATIVHGFVQQVLAADKHANVVVAGDLNDFDFSQTADILVAGGVLRDLPRTLPLRERYSYVYQGNSEVLDHVLLSPELARAKLKNGRHAWDYDVVHVNSEFPDQVSDHDPQIVRLTLS